MMAYQLSSATATRGVAVKAPRATAPKARVATRVQAVRPPLPLPSWGAIPTLGKPGFRAVSASLSRIMTSTTPRAS
jgi:hypothetical protein